MPEDGGLGVIDAVDVSVNDDISSDVSTESTDSAEVDASKQVDPDKQDGRKATDWVRQHIADLRKQLASTPDPQAKQALQERIKQLYDSDGALRGYKEQIPTVREAREVRALLESVGGREGFQQMQATLSRVEQVDAKLSAGDETVIDDIWNEAPEGMPKLVAPIVDKFESVKPQEYSKFIAPRAVKYFDAQGFPQAFDRMAQLYEAGKIEEAQEIRYQLNQFVVGNRQSAQQQRQVDPEVERLRQELEQFKQSGESQKVEQAYNTVIDHAGPAIDKFLKPLTGKLGLSGEQYNLLRNDVWNHLQDQRNTNDTYKTIAPAKQKQGYDKWTEYAKRWTEENADASARAMVKARYGHQLTNGAKPVSATQSPTAVNVQRGKEPMPSEIDYSGKGKMAAQKAGFRTLEDMILSGQAPLKIGGIRKWR